MMPTSVRVMYRVYAIEPMPHDFADNGQHCSDTATIRVKERDPVTTANTMLHEIMHACWDAAHLDESAKEERAVGSLTNVLCQVIQDNPHVIEWILKGLRNGR